MEFNLTLKTPYRRFMTTDRFRITASQGFARIQHTRYDQDALGVVVPIGGDPPPTPTTASANLVVDSEVLVPDQNRKLGTEITYITTGALTSYVLLLAGSQTCIDREVTLELVRTSSKTSILKTIMSLSNNTAPNPEVWSKHRDWHLRTFGLGTDVQPTPQEVNVRGRLARGQFLADVDGFMSVAKSFEEVEQFLERTVDRYVKVFRSVLDKQDDGPLSLKQLAYASCLARDRREIDGMVDEGQMGPVF
ncbi:uncharacterized protein SPPG_05600 [Spizellomyces punctatus DAOM BR117]|uniref:Uncharacterized protein n=1 Tax=Spizellomyces punctatus (strain DAOM BR117) TaxID=645134 RepID=A0A0L0HF01_SPIPD|nr:uncharacterized protein SPPG_05600 [Spizellomyces punctatus DAOM BR117]KNC99353.1 hypothetical protein SPPG_05600 [Spizellomyces punctatus DAOM BR117]|eukprot:XP_016607393.1 hypothetical protein SPPG_05600 [Spizellomyces punctatus DAOM BR117]